MREMFWGGGLNVDIFLLSTLVFLGVAYFIVFCILCQQAIITLCRVSSRCFIINFI